MQDDDGFGSEKLIISETNEELMVNKRVVISGENLIDAQPKLIVNLNQLLFLLHWIV